MRGVRALAASAVTALVVFGCNSILGIDKASFDPSLGTGGIGTGGGTGTGGGIGTGGLPTTCDPAGGDSRCTTCEKNSCCSQTTTCAGNLDCVALVSCVTACGTDSNCSAACATTFSAGATAALDLANCVNSYCPECNSGQTCGASLDVDPTLVKSCVLGMSCDPYPPTDISSCITLGYPFSLPFLACQYTANSCEDIGACTGEYYADSSVCTGSGTGWVCQGNIAHNCDAAPMVVDCGFWGGTCDGGSGWPCSVPIGGCPVADTGWHCSGDYAYTCINGVPHGYSCSVQSGVCVDSNPPGQAGCTLSTATCSNPNAQLCDGNALTYCNPSDYLYQYDCSVIGGTCQTSTSGSGFCYAPGCTPDSNCTESCSGSVMTLCIGRAPMQVDCTQYGFSACTSKTDTSGYTTVSCVR